MFLMLFSADCHWASIVFFSNQGNVQASLALFVWLNKNVRLKGQSVVCGKCVSYFR